MKNVEIIPCIFGGIVVVLAVAEIVFFTLMLMNLS